MIYTVLTIAGSDPSGGAGVQADLKTFSRLDVYGMAVLTALTAQNTTGVQDVFLLPAAFVARQLDSVLADIRPDAVKTGMLGTAQNVVRTAAALREHGLSRVVVDPVIASTSGRALLEDSGIEAMRTDLFPLALIVTPNMDEAGMLTGTPCRDEAGMHEAARRIHAMGVPNVLIKGGHLNGDAVDVLFDGRIFTRFVSERVQTSDLHGTGCVLSSAIAASLSRGIGVPEAVRQGKDVVTDAIRTSLKLGSGSGPVNAAGLKDG